jgi:hypothetical protein
MDSYCILLMEGIPHRAGIIFEQRTAANEDEALAHRANINQAKTVLGNGAPSHVEIVLQPLSPFLDLGDTPPRGGIQLVLRG